MLHDSYLALEWAKENKNKYNPITLLKEWEIADALLKKAEAVHHQNVINYLNQFNK